MICSPKIKQQRSTAIRNYTCFEQVKTHLELMQGKFGLTPLNLTLSKKTLTSLTLVMSSVDKRHEGNTERTGECLFFQLYLFNLLHSFLSEE